MSLIKSLLVSVSFLLPISALAVNQRSVENIDLEWRFHLGDVDGASQPGYDDSGWRRLDLPHDWAVEGDFSQANPSGVTGGALPGGVGWYRKTFIIDAADEGKRVSVLFEGSYMNTEVFVNGRPLGVRPYGYVSFGYDITPYIKWGGENVVAVRVDNSEQPNSRWYSGCGIYRSVYLVKTAPLHIARWGTYAYSVVTGGNADLNVETTVENDTEKDAGIEIGLKLLDAGGETVAAVKYPAVAEAEKQTMSSTMLSVGNPHLWDTASPYLYRLVTDIYHSGNVIDSDTVRIGFRTIAFDAEKGFFLNGRNMKINGVCLHHDHGCLGAAFNRRAMQRQLQMMKDMGCNAIRCSHNPPSPEMLDLCDEMGLLVMDEAFDMWRKKKTAHDYARYFDEWHERDLCDFVMRDRNHPSVFMWSIGNEILEQWPDADAGSLSAEDANLILNKGHELGSADGMSANSLLALHLAGIVRGLDSTRPVTAGCNEPSVNNHVLKSGALDVVGYNYHNGNVASVPENFPGMPFLITESNSALATRGYYRMPSDTTFVWPYWDKPFSDPSFSCSSYDNCHVPWGSTSEETFSIVSGNDFVSGQFVWTGFDYLGEPSPYGWPARSSYFGLVDLAGIPKDSYYLFQSEWSDTSVLHLFPHWNWTSGQDVDMWCYYNDADSVELIVNGKSAGFSKKTGSRRHAEWRVRYEPGMVEAVAWKNGEAVRRKVIRTAGSPAQVRLTPDRREIAADGRDLSYVTVEILDKDGNLCPDADNLVKFEVKGSGFIAGVDNGSQTSMERFKDNKRKAFYGKCMLVVQNNGKAGRISVRAVAEGLKEAEAVIASK